jgi:hypothetical protein
LSSWRWNRKPSPLCGRNHWTFSSDLVVDHRASVKILWCATCKIAVLVLFFVCALCLQVLKHCEF